MNPFKIILLLSLLVLFSRESKGEKVNGGKTWLDHNIVLGESNVRAGVVECIFYQE